MQDDVKVPQQRHHGALHAICQCFSPEPLGVIKCIEIIWRPAGTVRGCQGMPSEREDIPVQCVK
jgi:hypothetical protein